MGQEGEAACSCDGIEQGLRISGQGGKLLVGLKYEEVILLRIATLVMDFLAGDEKDTAAFGVVVTVHTIYPDIVIGRRNEIEPGAQRGRRHFEMGGGAVRVARVDVEIADVLVGHGVFPGGRGGTGLEGPGIVLARSVAAGVTGSDQLGAALGAHADQLLALRGRQGRQMGDDHLDLFR